VVELFEVTGIRTLTEITPEGAFERMVIVSFRTKSGVDSEVKMREIEFTEAKALEMIREKARTIERVMALEE